jgi:flagellar biosynthetic protein FliQ
LTPQLAIHVMSEALLAAFFICAPLLLIAFVLGIVINIIQIATSLQDQVFSTVPRLVACLGGFLFLMPWMLNRATGYTLAIMRDLVKFAH